jgi:6,7-dimethyl-8-ribityllumazine synthase
MGKIDHTKNAIPRIEGAQVVILQTKWYREYVDNMVSKCVSLLEQTGARIIGSYLIPGAVELPLAAQTVARSSVRPDAIICFGGILKGDTFHFEMISNECSRGLGEVMLREDMPIINEVIAVFTIDDLKARSQDDEKNKGIEAAYATAEIISWRRKMAGKLQPLN